MSFESYTLSVPSVSAVPCPSSFRPTGPRLTNPSGPRSVLTRHEGIRPGSIAGRPLTTRSTVSTQTYAVSLRGVSKMPKRRGRGEGSVEPLPSGSFRACVVLRTILGKKDRLTHTCKTKTEALAWLRARQAEHSAGKLSASKITLGEFLTEWLARRIPTVQPKTAQFYTEQVGRLRTSSLSTVPVRKLTRHMFELDIPAWGTSDQRRKALRTVRTVLNSAVESGIISNNPARGVRMPISHPKLVSYWTAEEAQRVLAAADGQYLPALFWLALDGGLRIGELLGLHWTEVQLEASLVRVVRSLEDVKGVLRLKEPKTANGRRTIRIGKWTCAALETHRRQMKIHGRDTIAGPVFVGSRSGRLISHSTFYSRYYRPVIKAAGVPPNRPYDMRHTCATQLLALGVGVKVVAERLGHADISTTLRHYAHCLPDAQDAAARAADSFLMAPRDTHEESEQANT